MTTDLDTTQSALAVDQKQACSALDAAWKSINSILRGTMDYADFKAGWEACAKHIRETESIQITGCPRCDHEFEAEVTFESLEPNDKTQPPDSWGAATGSAFPALENAVLEYLDALDENERVERIDDLLHRLNFERRLTLLAPNQREAMNDRTLHPTQRARLDACKTEAERDKLIGEMARTQYFRDCAWVDYLNGGRAEPPVMPNTDSATSR